MILPIGPFVRNHLQGNYSRSTIETIKHPMSEKLNHNLVAALVHHLHSHEGPGAILVFLPGWDDISKVSVITIVEIHSKVAGIRYIFVLLYHF